MARGITPDIVVEKPQEAENQEGEQKSPRSRRQIELPGDDLSDDPQLQKAVDFLKTRRATGRQICQGRLSDCRGCPSVVASPYHHMDAAAVFICHISAD